MAEFGRRYGLWKFIMVYENCRVYGPYKRKNDGREHVILIFDNGVRKTVSYPKYLVEKRTEKYLRKNETVDHLNDDFMNNDKSNVRTITRSKHASNDAIRLEEQTFVCPQCNTQFVLKSRKLSDAIQNRKKHRKAGPFCTRNCAGRYGKAVQLGMKPLQVEEIKPNYTTNKYLQGLNKEIY